MHTQRLPPTQYRQELVSLYFPLLILCCSRLKNLKWSFCAWEMMFLFLRSRSFDMFTTITCSNIDAFFLTYYCAEGYTESAWTKRKESGLLYFGPGVAVHFFPRPVFPRGKIGLGHFFPGERLA